MFKKVIVIFSLFFSLHFFSQNANYNSVVKIIKDQFPEINFENKLLAISIWNSEDLLSRDANKEMLRVYNIYRDAKLSGGLKGVIFISISTNRDEMQYTITEKKDMGDYTYTICDTKGFDAGSKLQAMGFKAGDKNIVFDANGKLVYYNLMVEVIFKSFNALITR